MSSSTKVTVVAAAIGLVVVGAALLMLSEDDSTSAGDRKTKKGPRTGSPKAAETTKGSHASEGDSQKPASTRKQAAKRSRATLEQRRQWQQRRAAINERHVDEFGVEKEKLDDPGAIDAEAVEKWKKDPRTGEAMVAALEELMPVVRECLTLGSPDLPEGTVVQATAKLISDPESGILVEEANLAEDSPIQSEAVRECLTESIYTLDLPNPGINLREGLEFAVDVAETEEQKGQKEPEAQ